MNCEHCKQHIVATTQISWRGYNYHTGCIGEAVAAHRAQTETSSANENLSDEYDAFNDFDESTEIDDEYFDNETDDFETEDFEEIINRLDDEPDISDEILDQIPMSVTSGKSGGAHIPERLPPVPEFSHPVTVATDNGKVGTLISGMKTTLINREALRYLPLPEQTDTFKPIPHFELVDEINKSLSFRRLSVVREEYAVSPDGMKLFGLIELNVEYSGVRFAIGLRNANDKSMRVGLVAGYRVIVCENKMLTGDFNPLLAKHSKHFNLVDALSVAVDRIHRNIGEVSDQIERKKLVSLSDTEARNLIYRGFLNQKFPISLLRTVHNEYFEKPSYEEFKEKNLWSLENSFTTAFKKLKPVQQFEAAAKLGKFLAPMLANNN